MYFVYVLKSLKDNKFYTGCTTNLERRIIEHNNGMEVSTKSRTPFELIYYEWCQHKDDALQREAYLKSGVGKKYIRNRLKHCFGLR
jgi:putative endonuclease